jgi:hypothetical protein
MLAIDFIIGGVIFAGILLCLFVGMAYAARAQRQEEATAARRSAGTADVLDVSLVSQRELDEVWKYLQTNQRELAVR